METCVEGVVRHFTKGNDYTGMAGRDADKWGGVDDHYCEKHKDDTERIDPVAAAMNALARLLVKRDQPITLATAIRTRNYHL